MAAGPEYFLASAAGPVPLPEGITDAAVAQLIAMPFSAITLSDNLAVGEGDWNIQNTANGTLGRTLATLAKARGMQVVNLVRRDAGIGEMAALGIGNVVSTATEGWQDRVRALTAAAPLRCRRIVGQASGDLALPVEAIFGCDEIRRAAETTLAAGNAGKVLLCP